MFRQAVFFLFLVIFLPFHRTANGQGNPAQKQNDEWKLEKDKNGIQVYSRHLDNSRLKEVKVVCDIKGTLNQLVAFIFDIDRYKEVVYRVKDSYLVRKVSDREFYYYNETSMPWPVQNRDLVLHMTLQQEKDTRIVYIHADNVPGMLPEKKGKVRVPSWYSLWTVQETDNHRLKINYVFQVDPGGELPVWLVNATVAVGPYQSFSMIEETLKQPQYQGKTFSFLKP
ncbi:START domain-containing protein [Spirosoma aerophilum]